MLLWPWELGGDWLRMGGRPGLGVLAQAGKLLGGHPSPACLGRNLLSGSVAGAGEEPTARTHFTWLGRDAGGARRSWVPICKTSPAEESLFLTAEVWWENVLLCQLLTNAWWL